MALDRIDFDNLSEGDLKELVDNGIPESERLEYKRELYGGTDAEKKELLKDVSGLLNKRGGHLVIGIGTSSGIPIGPMGVPCRDADAEKLRLVSILRTAIDPTPIGVRVQEVLLASGEYCFVVRVPQSWNAPHRVTFQGINRFYVRNPGGVHEPSMTELRHLFGAGQDAIARARTFRDQRLERIGFAGQARALVGPGQFIVHLVPLATIELSQAVVLDDAMKRAELFRPLSASLGFTPRINFDGLIVESGGERNFGYTQVFRNGAIEATKGAIVLSRPDTLSVPFIASRDLEQGLVRAIPSYLEALRALGIAAPVLVMITVRGVAGSHYGTRQRIGDMLHGPALFEEDELRLPECVVESYGTDVDYHRAIKPAFDALWNAMGDFDDLYYDHEGRWTGNIRPAR